MSTVTIILHKYDPATRIFSGNAIRPVSGGLEVITVEEDTLRQNLTLLNIPALIHELDTGYARTLKGFWEEWIVGREKREVGTDRVEGYGESW